MYKSMWVLLGPGESEQRFLSLHPTAHVLLLTDAQQLSFGSVLNYQHKNSEEVDLYA